MEDRLNSYTDFVKNGKFIEWRLFRTEELDRYWTDFVEKNPEQKQNLLIAVKDFESVRLNDYKLRPDVRDLTYQKIIERVRKQADSKRRKRIFYRIAAACISLLVVTSAIVMLYKSGLSEEVVQIAATDTKIGQILPSSKIQLVTSDKVVELEQNGVIELSKNGQSAVINDEAGVKEIDLSSEAMNYLIVPSGKRSSIELADGSKVWINSDTKLQFPASFKDDARKIHVEGEIYIEVFPMKDRPFQIQTAQFDVLVLGTKFNLSTYSDSDSHSVVLVEGAVKVNTNAGVSTLNPGDLFSFSNSQFHVINGVNTNEYISWKDGILIFNNTPISEILKKIGRFYNVDFEYDNDLLRKTCTGKLFLADNLDDVMISLSTLSSTIFYRENETVYIKK